MFRRSRGNKANVNIPKRKWKSGRTHHSEWDSTVSDLSVHKASEDEIQRRRIIHKSKNAGAAKRALKERTRKLVDIGSPGQVELEMKKLAILKEVLYDHDDLNEVLRRVDTTMTSVKSIFHEVPSRKSGHPNVTLAPGPKMRNGVGPVLLREEQPTQMSLLSDSVMDKQALNDEAFSSDEDEAEEEQFESKVEYERFLNVLRESLNKTGAPPPKCDAGMTTPGNEKDLQLQRLALNCTEEVKRTMSRFGKQAGDDEEEAGQHQDAGRRRIDDTIDKTIASKTSLESRKKNQTVSFSMPDASYLPPRANLTATNMTYESLQEAMQSVTGNISEMEMRRGRTGSSEEANTSVKSDGLAGFTATLIDAVTRLTVYVNEAEGKILENESQLENLKSQNDHQRALFDALTAELMSTQEQIKTLREESSKNAEDSRKREEEMKKSMQEEMEILRKQIEEMIKTDGISKTDGSGDAVDSRPRNIGDSAIIPALEEFQLVEGGHLTKGQKEKEEAALKSDMLSLLGALKAQPVQKQPQTQAYALDVPTLPMNNKTTKEAAQTVACVESQLRHLQIQHAEAQNRMQELTQVAGFLAGKVADTERSQSVASNASSTNASQISDLNSQRVENHSSSNSISSGSITPKQVGDSPREQFHVMIPSKGMDDTDDTISGITISSSMFATAGGDVLGPSDLSSRGGGASPSYRQAAWRKFPEPALSSKSSESLDVDLSDHSFHDIPKKLPVLLQSNLFGTELAPKTSAEDNLSYLLQRLNKQTASVPAFKPTNISTAVTKQSDSQKVTSSIQQTQCNLEDRIAELNRQHAEAQSRLHNLIRKRSDANSPSSHSSGDSHKVIQVTIPSDDMLKTPHIYKPPEPFRPLNIEEDSFF